MPLITYTNLLIYFSIQIIGKSCEGINFTVKKIKRKIEKENK